MPTSICNEREQEMLELHSGLKVKVVIKDKTGGPVCLFKIYLAVPHLS